MLVGGVVDNGGVTESAGPANGDSAATRKARGAFFTPPEISRYLTRWAIRSADDQVFEPAAGEAVFVVEAVTRLAELGARPAEGRRGGTPRGQRGHRPQARRRGRRHGAHQDGRLLHARTPCRPTTAVIGNPPYIRYQDFRGATRAQSRRAALKAGVTLSGLASSWAAFTVHAALFLKPGGRLALVLPAELLSVNYAAAVRKFLFDRFASVELVMFDEQVFPEAEADVVLLLADGYGGRALRTTPSSIGLATRIR